MLRHLYFQSPMCSPHFGVCDAITSCSPSTGGISVILIGVGKLEDHVASADVRHSTRHCLARCGIQPTGERDGWMTSYVQWPSARRDLTSKLFLTKAILYINIFGKMASKKQKKRAKKHHPGSFPKATIVLSAPPPPPPLFPFPNPEYRV